MDPLLLIFKRVLTSMHASMIHYMPASMIHMSALLPSAKYPDHWRAAAQRDCPTMYRP